VLLAPDGSTNVEVADARAVVPLRFPGTVRPVALAGRGWMAKPRFFSKNGIVTPITPPKPRNRGAVVAGSLALRAAPARLVQARPSVLPVTSPCPPTPAADPRAARKAPEDPQPGPDRPGRRAPARTAWPPGSTGAMSPSAPTGRLTPTNTCSSSSAGAPSSPATLHRRRPWPDVWGTRSRAWVADQR
jgi:hypothetical protein